MRSGGRLAVASIGALALTGCLSSPVAIDGGGGGDGPARDAAAAADAGCLWSTPQHLDAVDSAEDDFDPTLSAAGDHLILTRRIGGTFQLFESKGGPSFGTPAEITALESPQSLQDEFSPSLNGKGLRVYFTRTSTVSTTFDVLSSRRPDLTTDFDPPVPVSVTGDVPLAAIQDVAISDDGNQLYFDFDAAGQNDLGVAQRGVDAQTFTGAARLAGLNTNSFEGEPSISGDGLDLYFVREAGGASSILVSHRASLDADFAAPTVVLGDGMFNYHDPEISGDGQTLLFTSDRPGGDGFFDIWYLARTCP